MQDHLAKGIVDHTGLVTKTRRFESSRAMRNRYTLVTRHHPLLPIALSTLWLATVANVPLWRKLAELPKLQNMRGLSFRARFGLALVLFIFAIISLLGWRRLLKPVLTFFFVSAAIGAYFMVSYGIVIDSTMIVNVPQTDPRKVRDLLNWRLVAYLVILGVPPSARVWRGKVREVGNLYLHGLPYSAAPAVQKQVPWITWLSPSIQSQRAINSRCMRDKIDLRLSHDNYFYSVLALVGVRAQEYRVGLDIYASCRRGAGET